MDQYASLLLRRDLIFIYHLYLDVEHKEDDRKE